MQHFEIARPHSSTVDGGDLYPVQTDEIRAVRRARAEGALLRPGGVPSRVHAQNVATSAIEPSDDDDLIAGPDAPQTLKHLRLEDQPGLGCAFVGLPGGELEIGQGRLDPPDGLHLENRQIRLPIRYCPRLKFSVRFYESSRTSLYPTHRH